MTYSLLEELIKLKMPFPLYNMRNRELKKQLQRIKWLIDQTAISSMEQLEIQAHWGQYLCILVSGFLENAIGEIYSEYAKQASSEPVAKYVSNVVMHIRNPKAQKFVDTAKGFKGEWGDNLESYLSNEGRKEAIDGIMANRHLIAHGQSSGITVTRVKIYLERCVEVIEYLEKQCGLI